MKLLAVKLPKVSRGEPPGPNIGKNTMLHAPTTDHQAETASHRSQQLSPPDGVSAYSPRRWADWTSLNGLSGVNSSAIPAAEILQASPLSNLQQTYGNQALLRVLRRPARASSGIQSSGKLQPQFTISQTHAPIIQRRILIGSGRTSALMTDRDYYAFVQSVINRTLNVGGNPLHRDLVFRSPALTARILKLMHIDPQEFHFASEGELLDELFRRIDLIRHLLGQVSPTAEPDWVEVQLPRGPSYLRREVYAAFLRMQQAAQGAGHNLQICSATRTFAYQLGIWSRKMNFETGQDPFGQFEPTRPPVSTRCAGILTDADRALPEWNTGNDRHRSCWFALTTGERAAEILKTFAAPGTSRHHWGTEIDLNSLTPREWEQSPLQETYTWLVNNAHRFGFYQPYTARPTRGNRGYTEEKWHWSYMPIAQPLLSEYQRLLFDPDVFRAALAGQNVEAIDDIVSHYQEYVEAVASPPSP